MKECIQRKLAAKKLRRQRRIEKQKEHQRTPMLSCPKTKLELSDIITAVNCGCAGSSTARSKQQLGRHSDGDAGVKLEMLAESFAEADR